MALQLGALRTALLEAGATQDNAERAAEEVAGYDSRLAASDTKVAVLMVMVGGLYALTGPMFWLLWKVAAKVGAL
jgi:hypothetical protein